MKFYRELFNYSKFVVRIVAGVYPEWFYCCYSQKSPPETAR